MLTKHVYIVNSLENYSRTLDSSKRNKLIWIYLTIKPPSLSAFITHVLIQISFNNWSSLCFLKKSGLIKELKLKNIRLLMTARKEKYEKVFFLNSS